MYVLHCVAVFTYEKTISLIYSFLFLIPQDNGRWGQLGVVCGVAASKPILHKQSDGLFVLTDTSTIVFLFSFFALGVCLLLLIVFLFFSIFPKFLDNSQSLDSLNFISSPFQSFAIFSILSILSIQKITIRTPTRKVQKQFSRISTRFFGNVKSARDALPFLYFLRSVTSAASHFLRITRVASVLLPFLLLWTHSVLRTSHLPHRFSSVFDRSSKLGFSPCSPSVTASSPASFLNLCSESHGRLPPECLSNIHKVPFRGLPSFHRPFFSSINLTAAAPFFFFPSSFPISWLRRLVNEKMCILCFKRKRSWKILGKILKEKVRAKYFPVQ